MIFPPTTCVINLRNLAWVAEAKRLGRYVYIGRPGHGEQSIWFNDWSHLPKSQAKYHVASLREALTKFDEYIVMSDLFDRIGELDGKILGCFCASINGILGPARPWCCHGQILAYYVELINGRITE